MPCSCMSQSARARRHVDSLGWVPVSRRGNTPEGSRTGCIAAASAGIVGAARFRSGSGKANDPGALVQVIEPLPWSWMIPTDRHVASEAYTFTVLPPVRLNPIGPPDVHPDPFELDWTFAYALTIPVPVIWIALHIVGLSASIPNGNVRF